MAQSVVAAGSAGPLGLIILAVVIGAMFFTSRRAVRSRRHQRRTFAGPLAGGSTTARRPGSAASIVDGGQIRAQELLGALNVRAELDEDADAEDEGTGAMLGLRYHRYSHLSGDLWEPTVYDGTRNGHQAYIRLGRNISARGPGLNFRRARNLCAVRVAAPSFELDAAQGRLRATTPVPPAIAAMIGQIAPSPDVWHDLRVVAGPDGLVASRAVADDWLGGWIYDLWLLERMAACLAAPALAPQTLGREWVAPYGMGDWAPTVRDSLRGS